MFYSKETAGPSASPEKSLCNSKSNCRKRQRTTFTPIQADALEKVIFSIFF